MTTRPEIPMYHHARSQARATFSSTRRRRSSNSSNRRGRTSAACWWVVIISPLILIAFCLGIFLGHELVRVPKRGGISIDQGGGGGGAGAGNGGGKGPYVPRLEHPTGWHVQGGSGSDAYGGNPPPESHLRGDKPHHHGEHEFPHVPQLPSIGDPPGGGGGAGLDLVPEVPVRKGGVEMPWLDEHSFRSRDGAYVAVKDSLDNAEEVTAMAWILIDQQRADIKTVMGNKMSGCGSDALGFALYINEWEKNDGSLWLEWGDGAHGCEKLKSPTPVGVGQWVHVGVRVKSQEVALFIDGYSVASTEGSRRPGSRQEFTIGAFADGSFPFQGRISAVTVFGSALTDQQIADFSKRSGKEHLTALIDSLVTKDDSLMVALQLDEAAKKEKDGMDAANADCTGNHSGGTYHFLHIVALPEVDDNLKDGINKTPVTQEMKDESDELGRKRAKDVREAMNHAWQGYRKYAWGTDELAPKSHRGKESWGGMGVTLVDSLDTLWLMDMKDEFWEARDWVRDSLSFHNAGDVSVFETTIRELGGLLSAYDLSGDAVFKDKAKELGDLLLPAFNTQSGIPTARVNFRTGKNSGGRSVLAELGTLQVEFRYLSKVTGDPKYAEKANKVFDLMADIKPRNGLFPIYINSANAQPIGSTVTFGALGDSFYEYLLKAWLQGGMRETKYRDMYDKAMDGVAQVLIKKSHPSGLTYVSDWNGHSNVDKMDHLVCFLAGTLALGAQTAEDPDRADRDLKLAKELAYTCYQMYARQKTGLAPEMVTFAHNKDMVVGQKVAYNILRPETAEALFVLHQLTGDPIYRDWSWEIFQAFQKHCRLPVAFGSFPNVNDPRAPPEDRMESFFLAETLKYLYLIQEPDVKVDLTKYVFNTEAHPTRIFTEMQ